MRVHQQLSFVLLNRPYSETSWIVEILTRDYGRLALMAKGARRAKSRLKGVLLPFQPVLLSWSGKGEVPTLTAAEIDQSVYNLIDHELHGDALVCGFYCNELVINLLHRHDPHQRLFAHYHQTIMNLNSTANLTSAKLADSLSETLRDFEQKIMKETGYEISFEFEAGGSKPIDPAGHYRFQAGQGFVRVHTQSATNAINGALNGEQILNLATHTFSGGRAKTSLQKYLMRDILNKTLGNKKIVSRELFFPKPAVKP